MYPSISSFILYIKIHKKNFLYIIINATYFSKLLSPNYAYIWANFHVVRIFIYYSINSLFTYFSNIPFYILYIYLLLQICKRHLVCALQTFLPTPSHMLWFYTWHILIFKHIKDYYIIKFICFSTKRSPPHLSYINSLHIYLDLFLD